MAKVHQSTTSFKPTNNVPSWTQSRWLVFGLLMIYAVFSWFYARYNDGFYQGEEGAHYINMKEFWEDPSKILGNWAKTGWKLIFVLPVLGGKNTVLIWAILISCFTAWLCIEYAKEKGHRVPLLAGIFLLGQTFWFSLSFRPLCEPTAALFVVLACLLYLRKNALLATLAFSYALTIRQELFIPGSIFGLVLLFQKDWKAILGLVAFPFINNLVGWWSTGDLFYLFNNAKKAADFANNYMRPGGEHYLLMSPLVFGFIPVLCILSYLFLAVFRKLKPDWILIVPLVSYLLWESLSSMKSIHFGASTAGNLRYLLVMSPIVAIISSELMDRMYEGISKYWIFIPWVTGLFLLGTYCTYDHNFLEYADFWPHQWKLILPALLFVSIIPWMNAQMTYSTVSIFVLSVFSIFVSAKSLRLENRDENTTCKVIVDWCKTYQYEKSRTIYQSLPMFAYFYDKTPKEFSKGLHLITKESLDNSPIGSIVIWDSHYAANFGKLDYKYFEERPDLFVPKIQTFSPDSNVVFLIYERINK